MKRIWFGVSLRVLVTTVCSLAGCQAGTEANRAIRAEDWTEGLDRNSVRTIIARVYQTPSAATT